MHFVESDCHWLLLSAALRGSETAKPETASPSSESEDGFPSIRQRPKIEPQIRPNAVSTGEAAEGHGVESLAGEAGIAHAVEAVDAGAVEGHRQEAGQSHRRDRAVAAAAAAQEAAVAAGGAHLPVGDGARQARQDRLEAGDQAVGIGFLLGGIGRGGKPSPGLHGGGGEGVHDVVAGRGE